MKKIDSESYRRFAMQAAVLAWASLLVFWAFYAADFFLSPRQGAEPLGPF
jgi:hypothetical protein